MGNPLGGVPTTPDLIFLQNDRDTNGSRTVIQIGGVCTTFCQEGGILLQKYRDRDGRRIAILYESMKTVCANSLPKLFLCASCPLQRKEGGQFARTASKTICANSFHWGGWFLG